MTGAAVVVAVDDAQTRAAVARLAALAGVAAHDMSAPALRARWQAAAGVVIDTTTAQWCIDARLPRRSGVLLVAPGEPPTHAWSAAVAVGAEGVLGLPGEERQLVDWLGRLAEPPARAAVVCCLSARAGSGSSTLAAGLALAAGARGRDVLLIDADPYAGGVDLLLGIEDVAGSRWDAFADAAGVLSAAVLADALPSVDDVRVMSCVGRSRVPLRPEAMDAVLGAGVRGHDLVVVDTSNGGTDVATTVTAAADNAVVVVTAEVRAVAAAAGMVAEVAERCADVRLVFRPGPGGLRPRDVSDAVGAPVVAVWPRDRRLAGMVERGRFSRDWRHTNLPTVTDRLLDEFTIAAQ